MAGLFCKELMIQGDVERCLIIAPGSLVEQWQEELWQKFALDFRILTKDMIEAAHSRNPFDEQPLLIARLDHLSRNEDLQAKLAATDWDLIVVDEPTRWRRTTSDVRRMILRIGRWEILRHRDGRSARQHRKIERVTRRRE